jgi:hypothetical protein
MIKQALPMQLAGDLQIQGLFGNIGGLHYPVEPIGITSRAALFYELERRFFAERLQFDDCCLHIPKRIVRARSYDKWYFLFAGSFNGKADKAIAIVIIN